MVGVRIVPLSPADSLVDMVAYDNNPPLQIRVRNEPTEPEVNELLHFLVKLQHRAAQEMHLTVPHTTPASDDPVLNQLIFDVFRLMRGGRRFEFSAGFVTAFTPLGFGVARTLGQLFTRPVEFRWRATLGVPFRTMPSPGTNSIGLIERGRDQCYLFTSTTLAMNHVLFFPAVMGVSFCYLLVSFLLFD